MAVKREVHLTLLVPKSISVSPSLTEMANAVKIDGAAKLKNSVTNHPDRWDKIKRILTKLGKFGVDSAVNESLQLKGVTDKKIVHKIVQEGLKDQSPSPCLNDKKKQEGLMQAKMEEMLEDMNIVKQQNMTAAKSAEGSKPVKKIPNEGIKGLDLMQTNEKKVFIRSRL